MSALHLRLKRRLIFSFFLLVIVFIIIVGRLTYLQVFASTDLMEKAKSIDRYYPHYSSKRRYL